MQEIAFRGSIPGEGSHPLVGVLPEIRRVPLDPCDKASGRVTRKRLEWSRVRVGVARRLEMDSAIRVVGIEMPTYLVVRQPLLVWHVELLGGRQRAAPQAKCATP